MSLSVFFLPMARVGGVVTMRLMMRSSAGMMQTDDTHRIRSFPDCVWRLVSSVTRFRAFRYVPRAFRYESSCLPIRVGRRHFHAAICYFLIRDSHLHVSNPNLHVSKCHLQVSNHHLHVIGDHLRVVHPYDNQCGRFLLGLDEGSERR